MIIKWVNKKYINVCLGVRVRILQYVQKGNLGVRVLETNHPARANAVLYVRLKSICDIWPQILWRRNFAVIESLAN